MNRTFSKKPTNLAQSVLVFFSFLTFWTFSKGLLILIFSWELIRHRIKKNSFHKIPSNTQMIWITKTHLPKEKQSSRKKSWLRKADLLAFDQRVGLGQNETLWATTYCCREIFPLAKSVGTEKNSVLQRFLRWFSNKDVVLTCKPMQKVVKFYQKNVLICSRLGSFYLTWPTSVCTVPCVHRKWQGFVI